MSDFDVLRRGRPLSAALKQTAADLSPFVRSLRHRVAVQGGELQYRKRDGVDRVYHVYFSQRYHEHPMHVGVREHLPPKTPDVKKRVP